MIKVNKDYDQYLVCINPKDNIWQALLYKGEPDADGLCEVVVKEYNNRKPQLYDILLSIHQFIESEIDKKIEFGFVFNDKPVHLNKENEDNFFKTFVFASLEKQSGQNFGVFPCPFKLGTPEKSEIHIFQNFEELSEFCLGAFLFKKNCIMEGFKKKQEIDISIYYPYYSEEELKEQGIDLATNTEETTGDKLEPTEPAEPTEPVETTEKTEIVETVEQEVETLETAEPTEPVETLETAEPAETTSESTPKKPKRTRRKQTESNQES